MTIAKTNFLEAAILNHVLRNTAMVAPTASVFLALHRATPLTSAAAAAQNQIVVEHQVTQGVAIEVNVGGGTTEAFTVDAVAGAGPYTLTLSGNLANAWVVGTPVKFDIDDDCTTLNEPPGADGYAQLEIGGATGRSFTAPSDEAGGDGKVVDNTEKWTIGTPVNADWGWITGVAIRTATPNWLYKGNITVPKLAQIGGPFEFAIGDLDVIER